MQINQSDHNITWSWDDWSRLSSPGCCWPLGPDAIPCHEGLSSAGSGACVVSTHWVPTATSPPSGRMPKMSADIAKPDLAAESPQLRTMIQGFIRMHIQRGLYNWKTPWGPESGRSSLYNLWTYLDTEQDPVGLLGTKAFLCPPFLNYRI